MRSCSGALLGWARDSGASAAVEFAATFPLMVLLYVGAVETGNLLTITRRTTQVASTAADLTAQVKTVSTSDLGDVAAAASSIMTPYSTTPLKIVISSIVNTNNKFTVAWSYANKGGGRSTTDGLTLTGLTEPGSSVIVAEATYAFTPLVNLTGFFNPGSFNITRTFYERPRKSLTVTKTN
jgi:Flp pilus assembly protein TadG